MGKTFKILGIDGWQLELVTDRKKGGQHVGIMRPRMRVYNDDVGIDVTVQNISQMKARDLAIIAAASIIEYQFIFDTHEIRDEASRLRSDDEKPQTKTSKYDYEF